MKLREKLIFEAIKTVYSAGDFIKPIPDSDIDDFIDKYRHDEKVLAYIKSEIMPKFILSCIHEGDWESFSSYANEVADLMTVNSDEFSSPDRSIADYDDFYSKLAEGHYLDNIRRTNSDLYIEYAIFSDSAVDEGKAENRVNIIKYLLDERGAKINAKPYCNYFSQYKAYVSKTVQPYDSNQQQRKSQGFFMHHETENIRAVNIFKLFDQYPKIKQLALEAIAAEAESPARSFCSLL